MYGTVRPSFDGCSVPHINPHIPLESESGIPIALFREGPFLHDRYSGKEGEQGFQTLHACWGILPGLWSWHEQYGRRTWIWAPEPGHVPWLYRMEDKSQVEKIREESRRVTRWSRVHLFDIEVGAFALIVGARAGFSPGEFLDFLLGWFGADIAKDDRRWTSEEEPPPAAGTGK